MPQLVSTTPIQSDVEPSPGRITGDQYDLLVVNMEVGLTGIVSTSALSRDDAIGQYERENPACRVISVLMPAPSIALSDSFAPTRF